MDSEDLFHQALTSAKATNADTRPRSAQHAVDPAGSAQTSAVIEACDRDGDEPSPIESMAPEPRTSFPSPQSSFSGTAALLIVGHGSEHPMNHPPPASRLYENRYADVFEWNGSRPEDTLNDSVVRHGYTDKALPLLQVESHTARPNLWPSLRCKSCLPVISTLFAHIFEKRQARGKLRSPCAFKPPPRVTLTDGKREAWLRDLAHKSVPLRRLTRTIPHGVRGQVLLDQCISKRIPTARALWLAKCVGAIEMRAFRRRGVTDSASASHEAKWLIEWTGHVETSIETLIDHRAPDASWQPMLGYMLRLATLFFSESLLHQKHYLNWLNARFEVCPRHQLPLWLLLVQVHWWPLTKHRRQGHRFARNLVCRLRYESARPTTDLIKDRLEQFFMLLVTTREVCLIDFDLWSHCTNLVPRRHIAYPALECLASRNRRLLQFAPTSSQRHATSLILMYNTLDQFTPPYSLHALWDRLTTLAASTIELMHCLLEWACCPWRSTSARTHLAAALLRKLDLTSLGHYDILLDFLIALESRPNGCVHQVVKLIANLVESGHFPYSYMLQSLIVGVVAPAKAAAVRKLLGEVATCALSPQVRNLHELIANRIDASKLHERGDPSDLASSILRTLTILSDESVDKSSHYILQDRLDQLHSPQRRHVAALVMSSISQSGLLQTAVQTSPRALTFLTSFLVRFQCVDSLVLIIDLATKSDDADVLAVVTNATLIASTHVAVFGRLENVTLVLCERYQALRKFRSLTRSFLLALMRLALNLRLSDQMITALNSDLLTCNQSPSAIACSPRSDGPLPNPEPIADVGPKVGLVLDNEDAMDEPLLHQTVGAIFRQFTVLETFDSHVQVAQQFVRLHSSNPYAFERLALSRLLEAIAILPIDKSHILTATLVGSDCLTIAHVLDYLLIKIGTAGSSYERNLLEKSTVVLLPRPVEITNSPIYFRFRLAQEQSLLADTQMARLLCIYLSLSTCTVDENVEKSVRRIVTRSPMLFVEVALSLGLNDETHLLARFGQILFGFRDPLQDKSLAMAIGRLSCSTVHLVQFFCRLYETVSPQSEAGKTIWEHIKDAILAHGSLWPHLLPALSDATSSSLFSWAYQGLVSRAIGPGCGKASVEQAEIPIKTYTDVLMASPSSLRGEQMYDKLIEALVLLSTPYPQIASDMFVGDDRLRDRCDGIDGVCRLLSRCLKDQESLRQRESSVRLLGALCEMVGWAEPDQRLDACQTVFDTACLVASGLADEQILDVRARLPAKVAMNRQNAFLLEASQLVDDALVIARHGVIADKQGMQRRQTSEASGSASSPTGEVRVDGSPITPGITARALDSSAFSCAVGKQQDTKHTEAHFRPFEIVADQQLKAQDNDYSVNMTLFAARKVM